MSTSTPLPCTFPYAEGSTETRLSAGKAVGGALENLFCLVGFLFSFSFVFFEGSWLLQWVPPPPPQSPPPCPALLPFLAKTESQGLVFCVIAL